MIADGLQITTLSSPLTAFSSKGNGGVEEALLARAATGGDREAFSELVRRSQRSVFGLCYRLLGNREAASDAAQESFVRAFAALASFDPGQRFDIWVLRIARNHCFDILRSKASRVSPFGEHNDERDLSPTPHERLEAAEVTRNLESALDTLPSDDRAILALYYVQHQKTREIAEVLGIAPGTVMARLFRARQKLRKQLAVEET